MDNNEDIHLLIEAEELESFKFFCKKFDVKENDFLELHKKKFSEYMNENKEAFKINFNVNVNDYESHVPFQTYQIENVQTPKDLFKYFKSLESYLKTSTISTIKKIAPSFAKVDKLDIDFFRKFTSNDKFVDFLNDIYIINTFEYSIDLSTYIENNGKKFYVIRNYFMFDAILTHAIVPLIINSTTSVGLEGKSKVDESNHNRIAKFLFEITEKMKHEILDVDTLSKSNTLFNPLSKEVQLLGTDLYYGIKLFSLFHEYSHILFSHFDEQNKSNFYKEIEADNFAINLLVHNTLDYYKKNDNNPVYNAIIGIRIISPLIYFLLQISSIDKQNSVTPSYISRWEYSKIQIQKHLDDLNLLENMHNMITDLEKIFFSLLKSKGNNLKNIKKLLSKEAKMAEEENISTNILTKDNILVSIKVTKKNILDIWNYRLKFDI